MEIALESSARVKVFALDTPSLRNSSHEKSLCVCQRSERAPPSRWKQPDKEFLCPTPAGKAKTTRSPDI